MDADIGANRSDFRRCCLFNTAVSGLAPGQTYTFRWTIDGQSPCPPSTDDVVIKIDPLSVGGTTAGATTICAGTNSGTVALSGQVGNVIRWESSVNGTTWNSIASTATSISYSNLSSTTRYRAVVQSGVCATDYSTETIITVNQKVTAAAAGPIKPYAM
ncbi:hypothetical protein GHT06_007050 [Daphnia sinensis]|uniref:Uncharacterized protein n=1 Tax=Daphnia sinensis TaxID=1820382 RepID=A0AAD5PJS9_9CRUS|nr:hypothetical protein GHT06_007050 [Daphnia sinensis]